MNQRIYRFNYQIIFLVLLLTLDNTFGRQQELKRATDEKSITTINERGWWNSIAAFSGNSWNLKITNDGSFGTANNGAGGEWPRGSNNSIFWSSGLWIGVNNENGDYPRVSGRMYQSDFRPGLWEDGEPWNDEGNDVRVANRLLGNTYMTFNQHWSYESWPVDKGAPWVDNDGDGVYNVTTGDRPYMPLDQSVFSVYKDDEPGGGFGGEPIGAEVRQLLYGGASSHDASFSQKLFTFNMKL